MSFTPKVVPISVPTVTAGEAPDGGDHARNKAGQDAERAARYRLVIEEGAHKGAFVYKTMDRVTGEVIRQVPRETLIEMMKNDAYSSGAVIDTKA